MKVAMYYDIEIVRVEEHDIPKVGPGEVLVKNKIALTCGTDVKTFLRGHPLFVPPTAFGHEAAGEIVEVGPGVEKFKVGDRVVAHNSAPCNACSYCKVGQNSLCEDNLFNSGAFAEYQKIPARIVRQNMFKISPEISFEDAALLEPLTCAVYGADESNIQFGDVVVVNGAGPLGLMLIRMAYLRGAKVIATDLSPVRLEMAKKLGAKHVINVSEVENQVKAVRELTDHGADVVIDATGLPEIWEMCVEMVRKGGLVNWFGGAKPGTKVTLDTKLIHYSQITVKGVFHTTPFHVERAYRLIEQGEFKGEDFIGGRYAIEDIVAALRSHQEGKVIKNAIVF
jgi:L-iditol 2-dehydrogenase